MALIVSASRSYTATLPGQKAPVFTLRVLSHVELDNLARRHKTDGPVTLAAEACRAALLGWEGLTDQDGSEVVYEEVAVGKPLLGAHKRPTALREDILERFFPSTLNALLSIITTDANGGLPADETKN